jgi:hypothetical protein
LVSKSTAVSHDQNVTSRDKMPKLKDCTVALKKGKIKLTFKAHNVVQITYLYASLVTKIAI